MVPDILLAQQPKRALVFTPTKGTEIALIFTVIITSVTLFVCLFVVFNGVVVTNSAISCPTVQTHILASQLTNFGFKASALNSDMSQVRKTGAGQGTLLMGVA